MLTVAVPIVRRDLRPRRDCPECPEGYVLAFTKKLAVVVTVMLTGE